MWHGEDHTVPSWNRRQRRHVADSVFPESAVFCGKWARARASCSQHSPCKQHVHALRVPCANGWPHRTLSVMSPYAERFSIVSIRRVSCAFTACSAHSNAAHACPTLEGERRPPTGLPRLHRSAQCGPACPALPDPARRRWHRAVSLAWTRRLTIASVHPSQPTRGMNGWPAA